MDEKTERLIISTYESLRVDGVEPTISQVTRAVEVVSRTTVYETLKRNGIGIRTRGRRRIISDELAASLLIEWVTTEISFRALSRRHDVDYHTVIEAVTRANGGVMPTRTSIVEVQARPTKIRSCLKCSREVRNSYFCRVCKSINEKLSSSMG